VDEGQLLMTQAERDWLAALKKAKKRLITYRWFLPGEDRKDSAKREDETPCRCGRGIRRNGGYRSIATSI
jgi:hypothetical protein